MTKAYEAWKTRHPELEHLAQTYEQWLFSRNEYIIAFRQGWAAAHAEGMTANEYRVAALTHAATIRELRKEIEARDELEIELAKATAQRSMLAVDMSVILTIASEPLHPSCLESIRGICKQTLKTINQENQ